MASPFSVFRRNQRVLLAIVAITAMVAFVFLDPVMKYVSGRSGRIENPVVVETSYGALTQMQLESLRVSRDMVDRFLRLVCEQATLTQLSRGQLDPRMQNQAANQLYMFWRQFLTERTKEYGSEAAALETLVLAKRAEKMGMVVTDRAINDLIKQITDDAISSEQLQNIIAQLQVDRRRVSVARLFDALRTEMLASKMAQLFFQSIRDVPPAQRFEYFERLNRRVKAEIMPLAVSGFLGQVTAEPTADELRAFFDKYKNQFDDPASSEPGFKEPKRASFQYFKADFAKFKDEVKPQITDAEIAEYYEKNKAQFRAVELPADSEKPSDEAKEDESDTKKSSDEAEPQAIDKPADDKPAQDAAEPTSKPQDAAPQAGATRSRFRLVSAQDNANGAADKPAEQPAADQPAAATNQSQAEPAADATGSEKPAPAADQPPAGDAAAKPEEIKYEPLEKVKDTIRDSIASTKARDRITAIFEELQAAMRHHADERDAESASKTPKPVAPLPIEQLAKDKGVEAKALNLVSSREAATTDLGQVQRAVRRGQFDFRAVPFADFAFSDSFVTYKPETGTDGEGNEFLFWKTEEKAAYVPTLEQAREQVVLAWKTIRARELARKRAEELAGQARAAGKPMSETFANQGELKVIETKPFSWLTVGSVPFDLSGGQPRISEVDGVDRPGQEFMETVFGLTPGQLGVAMNEPENMVYVVRLVEFDRPADELRTDFAAEPPTRYMNVATEQRRDVYLAWLDDLNRAADVHWVRPADSRTARRGGGDMPPDDSDF
ncbi:MAG TPA: hypothetical protein VL175_08520 [Pirellulales bacterium]|nr:hypothetical protein [Pirellulales bacterium]